MKGTYESKGTRLRYSDTGSGAPVVFLHPTPLDGEYWRPVIEELAGIRAIVPDFRGHGTSELGNLPAGGFDRVPDAPVLTMGQLGADIVALLDHLQLQEAFFAGCSIGGYVLLELWRRAPQRMRGLMFVCSKPQPDTDAGLAKRAATIATARAEGLDKLFDGMAESLTGSTARKRRPEILAEMRAQMTLTVAALVAVQAGLATRPNSAPTVATINVPMLAIAGGEDPVVSEAEMKALRVAPGGCEWHLLANVGHFAAYEQPGKVASLMADWLRRHAA